MYTNWKKLEAHLEFLNVQEVSCSRLPFVSWTKAERQEYIRDETLNLRHELIRAQEEVKRIQSVPLVIGQFLEAVDEKRGIVGSTTGMFPLQLYLKHEDLSELTNRIQLCRSNPINLRSRTTQTILISRPASAFQCSS